MANDRMYIRCKGCGDLHYLAKCYDDGYFTTHEGEELRQGLDDFFDRHKWCYRDKYYGGFELVYESDEDAENEDERIRKWLVNYFKAAGKSWIHRDISPEQILAYLERQKEPENTSASTIAPSCWAVEQKEQKPDWSEEDEKMVDLLIETLDEGSHYFPFKETKMKMIAWLKSLRPQYHGDVTMTEAYKMGLEAGKASSWKPSEEQMEALKRASTNEYLPAKQFDILVSLYEQLKKLM